MSSTEENKEFDNCLPLRLNYEALTSIYITFPHWKFDQYCYVSNKLKEVEVNLKQGYNGDISAKDAGKIGGQMVKKMIEQAEHNMK